MLDLLDLEKRFLLPHIKKDSICVDFTMGNGYDTLFLAQNIGENGKVYSFDIQDLAISNTKSLLEKNDINNVIQIKDSHEFVKKYIDEKICVGMFNLGYLPGSDKTITTNRQSTLDAIVAALDILDNDGAITIAVYPGHEEGTIEGNLIEELLSYADRKVFCVTKIKIVNSPTSPYFFLVEKSEKRNKEKLAVSACLLGDNVRYNGKTKGLDKDTIRKLMVRYDLTKICPESFGELPIPREPSEQKDNKVFSRIGEDFTENFLSGAKITLDLIEKNEIKKALMKQRSPSCGYGQIYDGTFTSTIKEGNGITTSLLLKNKIKIYTEDDLDKLLQIL